MNDKLKDKLYDIKCALTPSFVYRLEDKKFNFKMSYQRFKRGYADIDWWCIDGWFVDHIVPLLMSLRDNHHGYPSQLQDEWEKENKELKKKIFKEYSKEEAEAKWNDLALDGADEKWTKILDRMVYCFRNCDPFKDVDLINPYEEEYDDWLLAERPASTNNDESISYAPFEHYEEYWKFEGKKWNKKKKLLKEGMDLFYKWFYHLWD